jgi:hypothetical protein
MNVRQTLILVVVFLLGILTAGGFIGRRAAADTPPLAAPPAAGRYQVAYATLDTGAAIKGHYVIVIDTATGECWYKDFDQVNANWGALGTPVKAK